MITSAPLRRLSLTLLGLVAACQPPSATQKEASTLTTPRGHDAQPHQRADLDDHTHTDDTTTPPGDAANADLANATDETAKDTSQAPFPPLTAPDGVQPLEHPEALKPLFDALAQIDAGDTDKKVRFLHYGDSHVASDLWTGPLRRKLQARFGDAGHGFILAGKPWRTYHHMDVDYGVGRAKDWTAERIRVVETGTDGRLGLGGVSIKSSERDASVWVGTERDGPVGQATSRFEVFFLTQPGGGTMALRVDQKDAGEIHTDGDVVKSGHHTVDVPDGPHRLDLRLKGDGEVRLFGFALERDRGGVVYDTAGINGARHTMALAWHQPTWADQLRHRQPLVLVTTYGANEAIDADELFPDGDLDDYTQQVSQVFKAYRDAVPEGVCLIIGPPDLAVSFDGEAATAPARARARARASADRRDPSVYDTPDILPRIVEALRAAAQNSGCAYWDTYTAMGGAGTLDRWVRATPPRLARRDRVHLSAAGYALLADKLYAALDHAYARYKLSVTTPPSTPTPAPTSPARTPQRP